MGYLGAGRFGVKRWEMQALDKKSGRWEIRNVREQKMGEIGNYARSPIWEQGDWATKRAKK